MATAGGVGVNWVSEALPGLWASLRTVRAKQPLADAYAAAIRQASQELQADYVRRIDSRSQPSAFALVAASAESVASAEFPPAVETVNQAQAALNESLAALLHGHDARQVAFLQEHLLPACARCFQVQLLQDEAAWRAFHGLILQALAANSAALLGKVDGFAKLLAAWSEPVAALNALHTALNAIEASLARLTDSSEQSAAGVGRIETKIDALASKTTAAKAGAQFNNQGMSVGGAVHQASGSQYIHSAHAQGGGDATVYNAIGAPTPPVAQPTPAIAPAVTILFLAANPLATARLRLDQEARTVGEALRQAKERDRFVLAQQWAVRTTDMIDALFRHRPQIVHFCGHGSPDGRLIFENPSGEPVAVSSAALDILFSEVGGIRCVVLNVCWSQRHAKVIAKSVDCVVGMAHSVSDAAAIDFVAGFYRTLGEGGSVQQAFELGRGQMAVSASGRASEKQTPKLLIKRGQTADAVCFVNK
jgi:hypothetical protein